jgi:UDPglucose 6-dehydrogenase
VTELADAIGHDARIGRRFLNAGVGFGGGCLPKDIRAFTARAEELGAGDSVSFLKEVDAINLRQRQRLLNIVMNALDGSVFGKKVAVLGLAFKPNSDDVRDSPALDVAVQLNGLGANVVATDPQAIANARARHPQLTYVADVESALRGANVVLLVTEWAEYVTMDPLGVGRLVNEQVVVDGRNALDSNLWRGAGWNYTGMGKP